MGYKEGLVIFVPKHETKERKKSMSVSDTKCAVAKIYFDFQNMLDVLRCFSF